MRYHQHVFKALTGLRGVGALWVTLFHLFHGSGIPALDCGYLGVDLFFLLSGFIICHVHAADFRPGYRLGEHLRFLQLRLARIYPLHVLVLLAFAVFVLTAPGLLARYHDPARLGGAAFVRTLLLAHNWGFGNWSLWNQPTWSLSAEWLAYLAFPLVAILTGRVGARLSLAVCLLALAALESVLWVTGVPSGPGRVGLLRIAFEFPAGCLLYGYVAAQGARAPRWLPWPALALVLAAVCLPRLEPLATCGFALLIVAVTTHDNVLTRLLCTPAAMRLGDVSFSLYMVHWPLIQVRNWAVASGLVGEEVGLVGVVLAIALLSWLCWRYIEVPARLIGRRLIVSAPARPGASVAT